MAIGDKIQLAFRSELVTVQNNVNTVSNQVNAASTGLAARVTNLEAGGSAGMTPQQVADLAACVTDKHAHANKAVLDLITAEYTVSEKTKLANITDNFKGLHATAGARDSAILTPSVGNYIIQEDTNTVWYFTGAVWLNTGVTSAGDMLKAIYDPTAKMADVFDMEQMVEGATNLILRVTERDKLRAYRGHLTTQVALSGLASVVNGHWCTIEDTQSIWIFSGGAWRNQKAVGGASVGDTKFSYRTTDHDGWYRLNGRSISTLSASAQSAAIGLGWVSIIPNTAETFTIAAGGSILLGSVGGTDTITRSMLPDFTLSGNTGNQSANHTHTTAAYEIAESTGNAYATGSSTYSNVVSFTDSKMVRTESGAYLAGSDLSYMTLTGANDFMENSSTLHDHAITINVPSTTSGIQSANHNHAYTTTSINGGVTQTTFTPRYNAKNEFVYLGL